MWECGGVGPSPGTEYRIPYFGFRFHPGKKESLGLALRVKNSAPC